MAVSPDDRRTLLLSGAGLGWIFGLVLAALAWQDNSKYAILQTPPVRMSLSEVLKRPTVEDRHVTLTDFVFGEGFAYETGAAAWVSVSIPVFPVGNLEEGTIHAIVESWDIRNEGQLRDVLDQLELTGILSDEPFWPGATRGPLLTEANPGKTLDKVWALHILRESPTITMIRITAVAAGACLMLGTLCLLIRRRDTSAQQASEDADRAND